MSTANPGPVVLHETPPDHAAIAQEQEVGSPLVPTAPRAMDEVRVISTQTAAVSEAVPLGEQVSHPVPRKPQVLGGTIRALDEHEARALIYIAAQTEQRGTACHIDDLDRHMGTVPAHEIVAKLQALGLIDFARGLNGIPLTHNRRTSDVGHALAYRYSKGMEAAAAARREPEKVRLAGDETPPDPRMIDDPRRDPRPAPTGLTGNARGQKGTGQAR